MMKSGTIPNYLCVTPLRHISLKNNPHYVFRCYTYPILDSPGF